MSYYLLVIDRVEYCTVVRLYILDGNPEQNRENRIVIARRRCVLLFIEIFIYLKLKLGSFRIIRIAARGTQLERVKSKSSRVYGFSFCYNQSTSHKQRYH